MWRKGENSGVREYNTKFITLWVPFLLLWDYLGKRMLMWRVIRASRLWLSWLQLSHQLCLLLVYAEHISSTYLKAWKRVRYYQDPFRQQWMPCFFSLWESQQRCGDVTGKGKERGIPLGPHAWEMRVGSRAAALSFHCFTGIFIYFLENTANLIVLFVAVLIHFYDKSGVYVFPFIFDPDLVILSV